MRVFDYCCGMGGLSYGFQKAGFEIEEGIDINDAALKTYSKYIKAPVKNQDLSQYYPGRNDFDCMIVSGPPCQGFSIANRKRNPYSKRSQLVLDLCRVIKAVQPRAFMVENVPHLSRWAKVALEDISGYKVTINNVNTSDYGVAQARKRVIILGSKEKFIELTPPPGIERHTVRDAIGTMEKNWGFVKHRPETIERFKKATSTKWISDTASKYQGTIRLSWDNPSVGIGNLKKFRILHPEENRVISLAEGLALHGFPDWYIPEGTDTQIAQQLADTVPPLLPFYIGKTIQQTLH